MGQQPYGFDEPERDRSETAPESPQYGYEQRDSYYDFTTIQPGSKGRKKRVSIRRVISTVLAIVGGCLFALPFLQIFGVFHFLGLGPGRDETPDYLVNSFSLMPMAFLGFFLLFISVFVGGGRK